MTLIKKHNKLHHHKISDHPPHVIFHAHQCDVAAIIRVLLHCIRHWRPCSLPINIVIPVPCDKRIKLYGSRREWLPDWEPHIHQKLLQDSDIGQSLPGSKQRLVYESTVRTWCFASFGTTTIDPTSCGRSDAWGIGCSRWGDRTQPPFTTPLIRSSSTFGFTCRSVSGSVG